MFTRRIMSIKLLLFRDLLARQRLMLYEDAKNLLRNNPKNGDRRPRNRNLGLVQNRLHPEPIWDKDSFCRASHWLWRAVDSTWQHFRIVPEKISHFWYIYWQQCRHIVYGQLKNSNAVSSSFGLTNSKWLRCPSVFATVRDDQLYFNSDLHRYAHRHVHDVKIVKQRQEGQHPSRYWWRLYKSIPNFLILAWEAGYHE